MYKRVVEAAERRRAEVGGGGVSAIVIWHSQLSFLDHGNQWSSSQKLLNIGSRGGRTWGGSELICLLHLQEEEELLTKRKLSKREGGGGLHDCRKQLQPG